MKDQTKVLADTWDNTFRTVQNNNSNWANINKVTNWVNNNTPKTASKAPLLEKNALSAKENVPLNIL